MKLSLLALSLLASLPAAQTVRTVGFWGVYPTVQDAVDAALDGDLVLILSGHEDKGFVVDGKSLAVIGTQSKVKNPLADVTLVRVRSLAPDQRVVLRGLDVQGTLLGTAAAVDLADNAGVVWLEDVEVTTYQGHGISANGCDDIVMTACEVAGFIISFGGEDGGSAVVATDSRIHAFDCVFHGVYGGTVGEAGFAGDGGDGLVLTASPESFLSATGCDIRGGNGGSAAYPDCSRAGAGGDGLVLSGWPAFVHDSVTSGGQAGFAGVFGCPQDGIAVSGGSALTTLPGEALTMATSSPVTEGGALAIQVHGPPLVPVFVGIGAGPDALFVASLSATLVLQGPHVVLALGVTSGAGAASLTLPLPLLPPGLDFSLNWGQSGYVASSGQVVLGAPSAVAVLDSAF